MNTDGARAGYAVPASVLLVSPHLDDAVLSAGATIAALTEAGARMLVCTVFAGQPEPPFSAVADDFHARCGLGADAMLARRKEDAAGLSTLGAQTLHLDYLDAIYRRSGPDWLCQQQRDIFGPGRPDDPELEDDVTRALGRLIAQERPAAVWTCAAIGGHIDHCVTRRAALAAAGGSHRVLLWEDLPYAFAHPPANLPAAESPPLVTQAHLRRKLDAIACYPSQVRMEWPGIEWRRLVTEQATGRQPRGGFELMWPAASETA